MCFSLLYVRPQTHPSRSRDPTAGAAASIAQIEFSASQARRGRSAAMQLVSQEASLRRGAAFRSSAGLFGARTGHSSDK